MPSPEIPRKDGLPRTFWSNINDRNPYLHKMIHLINAKGVAVWTEPPVFPVQNYPEYSSIHSSEYGLALLNAVYHSTTAQRIRRALAEDNPPITDKQITRRLRYSINHVMGRLNSQHIE